MARTIDKDERAYYRLRYPQADRPKAWIAGRGYEVSEISERGARIVLAGDHSFSDGDEFAGDLRFHDGESVPVAGTVMRTEDQEVVLGLDDGVSLQRMIAEQIYLRQKYPEISGNS